MSIPFPIGLIAGVSGEKYLTEITFDVSISHNPTAGGFEDETDADGGANLQNMVFSSTNPSQTIGVTIDLSADNILWNDRYNYRLGFANVYVIKDIRLFKDGVDSEYQSGDAYSVGTGQQHIGVNLDPSSRNGTRVLTGGVTSYPK